MAPESTIPCTPKTTLRLPIHMFAAYSVNTYPVLCSDLNCEQLCRRARVGGAVPTVMASPAFMELQSAFGCGAPPNLNMDTTFTQRQGETCKGTNDRLF